MKPMLNELDAYFDSARIPLRLACKNESDWPVLLSLWYLHQDDRLLCATQRSAKVVSYLLHDPRCAFEIAADEPPYCGVRGQAIATIDEEMGAAVLGQLLQRYLGGTENSLGRMLLSKSESEVAIILKPERITTWDFSSRMGDIVQAASGRPTKICP